MHWCSKCKRKIPPPSGSAVFCNPSPRSRWQEWEEGRYNSLPKLKQYPESVLHKQTWKPPTTWNSPLENLPGFVPSPSLAYPHRPACSGLLTCSVSLARWRGQRRKPTRAACLSSQGAQEEVDPVRTTGACWGHLTCPSQPEPFCCLMGTRDSPTSASSKC